MKSTGRIVSAFAAFLAVPATAQDEPDRAEPRAAIEAWLASEQDEPDLLETTVDAVLTGDGLSVLAEFLGAERRGAESLVGHVALGFMKRERERNIIYAGQFDDLRTLEPAAGKFWVRLLLDTPDWYPDDERPWIVPILRDLYPRGPARATLDAIEVVARDTEFEAEGLRTVLSYALAQWGRRELVTEQLADLLDGAGDGNTADELNFIRALAGLHYQLREYPAAASYWARFRAGVENLGDRTAAIDDYNAACVFALARQPDRALDAIERCCSRIAADEVGSSVPLTRTMFEIDPDLRAIRAEDRFRAAVKNAFDDR